MSAGLKRSNCLFDSFTKGDVARAWVMSEIRARLVHIPQSPSRGEFLLVGEPVTLTGKTITPLGAADADDIKFVATAGQCDVSAIILTRKHPEGAERVIALIGRGYGIPLTPNGGDIRVMWDNGPNRIFSTHAIGREWPEIEAPLNRLLGFAGDEP